MRTQPRANRRQGAAGLRTEQVGVYMHYGSVGRSWCSKRLVDSAGQLIPRPYVLPLKRRLTLDVGRGLPGSAGQSLKQGGRVVDHHNGAFVRIDKSKLRNAIAVAEEGRGGDVRFLGEIDTTEAATRKLVTKLATKYRQLTFCYEAGPTGYGLYRLIRKLGHDCIVVAPSLIPKKPGDRVKTNRRDAVGLAKLSRAGELTAVWVPDERHEAMRDPDLLRCCQAHRQSPDPLRLRKRSKSRGPSLHRSYPASSVLFPRPTPTAAAALSRRRGRYPRYDGSPPFHGSPSRRAVPTTPADRMSAHVDC